VLGYPGIDPDDLAGPDAARKRVADPGSETIYRNGKAVCHASGGGDTDPATLKAGFVAGRLLFVGMMGMGVIAVMVMIAGVSMIFGMNRLRIAMVRGKARFGRGHAADRAARYERGCQYESKNLL